METLNDLLEEPIDEPTDVVEPTEPTPEVEPTEEVEPKPEESEDVQAYRADQSKKDKRISALEKENTQYKNKTDDLGDRLSKLETPAKDVLTKPVRPVKPAGYNRIDATTDPDSTSYAYLEQKEAYDEQMEDYRDAIDTKRQVKEQADSDKALRVEQSTAYANEQIASYVEQGLSRTEAEECFRWWFTQDESRSPDVLVSGWKNKTKGKDRPPDKEKLKTPLPPGVGGGINEKITKTNADVFNEGLMKGEDRFTL